MGDEVLKRIRMMGIIGCICWALTAAVGLALGDKIGLTGPALVAELAIQGVMVAGVFYKSRIAACCLFGYFIVSKLLLWSQGGPAVSGIAVSIVIGIAYFRGMMATFEYHSGITGEPSSPGAAANPAPHPDASNPYQGPGVAVPAMAMAGNSCRKCGKPTTPGAPRCYGCGASLLR